MSAVLELTFPRAEPPNARFVLSPMWEALGSLRILQSRPLPALYHTWASEITAWLRRHGRHLTMLLDLLRAGQTYTPGFLFVPPVTPVPDLASDLAGLRNTSSDQLRDDLDLLSWVLTTRGTAGVPRSAPRAKAGPLPESLRELYDEPAGGLVELGRQVELYWTAAIAPRWGRLRALLTEDLIHRGRLTGIDSILNDLHPAVSWDASSLRIERPGPDAVRSMGSSDLLLMPSAFATAEPWPVMLALHRPYLTYPARGFEKIWRGVAQTPLDELGKVLGSSRARLLAAIQLPASTSDLASRTGLTPGGASQHLSALRAAGLISSHRSGHSVLHSRTSTAEALITNATSHYPN